MAEQYFRHLDGGVYRFVAHARSADNEDEVVVYEHLWPFDQSLWVRNRAEFQTRFTTIDEFTARLEMKRDRVQAQAAVTTAKAARRAAKQV